MVEVKINIAFRNLNQHPDSEKRAEHVFDRMQQRGITKDNIKEAVQKGAKTIRKDKSIRVDFRWFTVIYREFRLKDTRKIYPITVID